MQKNQLLNSVSLLCSLCYTCSHSTFLQGPINLSHATLLQEVALVFTYSLADFCLSYHHLFSNYYIKVSGTWRVIVTFFVEADHKMALYQLAHKPLSIVH